MNVSRQKANGFLARAAAVLTTGTVNSSAFNVNNTLDGRVMATIDFTVGSLTNGVFNPQVSPDGTNWYDVTSPGALTLTANGKKAFAIDAKGMRQVRVQVTGSGTVTSSSATINFSWQGAGGALG